jgi:hypothetical protein
MYFLETHFKGLSFRTASAVRNLLSLANGRKENSSLALHALRGCEAASE